jgi:hypothetical protein
MEIASFHLKFAVANYNYEHYFFMHCPECNNQRQTLKNTFTKLNINFNLQTILNGCETLNYHQNEELVLDLQLFIKNKEN